MVFGDLTTAWSGPRKGVFGRQTTALSRLRISRFRAWFLGITGVECADNVRGVGGIGGRLPRVLGYRVSFPLDLVVEFVSAISGI